METISGRFTYQIYKKDYYGVYRFKTSDETIVISGHFSDVSFDETYELKGDYYDHPKYGFQFKVLEYEKLLPDEKHAVIQYLSSDRFKGIGKKTAEVIYEYFKEDCLNILKEDATRIEEVDISLKQKQAIMAGFHDTDDATYQTHLSLISKGFNSHEANLIMHNYQDFALSVVENNPYAIYFDIYGIGFKKIDEVALSLGFETYSKERLVAYLSYMIQDLSFKTGHVFFYYEQLKEQFQKEFKDFDFDLALDYAIEEKKIIEEDTKYYYFKEYESETYIAQFLPILAEDLSYDEFQIDSAIEGLENEYSIEYDPLQKDAIHRFFKNYFSMIVGGPGTGKTTIVKALVEINKEMNPYHNICIVAPTGRAAKRISELCDVPSKTIHSLLLWDKETNTFTHDENNPLSIDVLIIDEFSMVDNRLFAALLKASQYVLKFCIIGDDEQLPSINAGNVLNDLIESECFPCTKLISNFRQASQNEIIQLANELLLKDIHFEDYHKDVVFVECNDHYADYLIKGIEYYKEQGFDFQQMQVLAPMYKGKAGIDRLNAILQSQYNPQDDFKIEYRSGSRLFREQDKILQLKNYADEDVYNGDIGILEIVDLKEKSLVVNFDGIYVVYNLDQLNDITFAYAMSVHKSQGSEYPLVFLIISPQHNIMLNRKLIYTAISRAKQKLVIIGSKEAFLAGIKKDLNARQTALKLRIINHFMYSDAFF